MKYKSTRNAKEKVSASDAILHGLASDGGLYMLDHFDDCQIDLNEIKEDSYQDIAKKVLSLMLCDYTSEEISECVEKAYTNKFSEKRIAPLVKVNEEYVLELFHGPTSAFKDVALSILPHLVSKAIKKQQIQDEIVILTATSGDTGKAALEGFKNVEGTQIVVFYPEDGVSEVQKAQMKTQEGNNVHVFGVKGNFDDCQNGVKQIFANEQLQAFMQQHHKSFSSANSINIGRLVPQIVYYFKAYLDLVNQQEIEMNEHVNFVVPSGNFGNILAGYFAKRMGLPIGKLICASNENNVLTDFIQVGIYNRNRILKKTTSPSMDILTASNLERLLYLLSDCNSELVSEMMNELKEKGSYEVNDWMKKRLEKEFYAGYVTDEQVRAMIKKGFEEYHYLMDPHTAVAYQVYENFKQAKINAYKTIILSTASPYKFSQSVLSSLVSEVPKNEFACMKQLYELSHVAIPLNLKDLEQKEMKHNDVIDIENMSAIIESLW